MRLSSLFQYCQAEGLAKGVGREVQSAEGGAMHQPTLFMQRWESERRYYVVMLAPNLFGHWELLQAWGGKGNRLGRLRALPVADYADGLAALDRVGRMRERRGYCLMQTRAV